MKTLIRQATLVNENCQRISDLLISHGRIEKIAPSIQLDPHEKVVEIDAEGLVLIPGMIDDQVHFREPGLTWKADLFSESMAAVAGGITSFMDMPNTIPNVLTQELLEEKYQLGAQKSVANYSFFMGISKGNLEEALKTNTENVCGITDDGLYFDNEEGILANYPEFLEQLFSRAETLVALHSEDDTIIRKNTEKFKEIFGDEIPPEYHSVIRNTKACSTATKRVLDIAKSKGNRLHFFHISSAEEALLFDPSSDLREKRITAEACVHHIYFNTNDYASLGNKIKWNPSIKSKIDNTLLIECLNTNRLDIIATDHAPHALEEKSGNYFQAKSGGPLVQHALPALLELYHHGKLSLEKIVEKTSHHVAEIYRIKERGYIREGYYADLVLIDLNAPWKVKKQNVLSKCAWSPFEEMTFTSKIKKTFVNGCLAYDDSASNQVIKGKRLLFEKIR
jgi:dihydroorotase